MKIRKYSTLLTFAILAIVLNFNGQNVDACSCMPAHPQTHFCNADYVVQLRVMGKTERLVTHNVVYKVQIKKAYKLNENGHRLLKHSRITTPSEESACGVKLDTGRIYVIAGRGDYLNACSYVKEYTKMTAIERRGFTNAYRKGCKCNITPCFGNQCLQHRESIDGCKFSPFAKCETEYSACIPSTYRTPEGNIARCHWVHTKAYNKCIRDP